MNDKREIFGWAMYDWASSAFTTTVVAVFLGPYLASLVAAAASKSPDGFAYFFGLPVAPDSFLPFIISFSVVFQAGLLPILGAIADYSHRRKGMLELFSTLGACSTIGFLFVNENLWWLGGVLFLAANVSYGASMVFYNAYLPDIASEDQRDRVSTYAWALGYLGGAVLLVINLILFIGASQNLLPISVGMAVRINLALAGVWWFLFAIFTWRRLKPRHSPRQLPTGENILHVAFLQLSSTMETPARTIAILLLSPLSLFALMPIVAFLGLPPGWLFLGAIGPIAMIGLFLWRKSRRAPHTARYLLAYLFYNDGIQTIISTAAIFAAAPLVRGGMGIPTLRLTLLVLMIQFVAFAGSLAFGWIARVLGGKSALVGSLIMWTLSAIYAYVGMHDTSLLFDLPDSIGGPMFRPEGEYWLLAMFIALALGGSQALSRSLFSQMVPKGSEAEFFSIYEISERGTSWLGPFLFAAVNQSLGDMRPAVLCMVIFFAVGLALLFTVNVQKAGHEARSTS